MVRFVAEKAEDGEILLPNDTPISVLDLGTGNGHLLFALGDEMVDRNIKARYVGVDYSPDSVAFAQHIAEIQYPNEPYSFQQADILAKDPFSSSTFDLIMDKGTLDAIALNQDPLPQFAGKIGMQVYPQQVERLMHANSVLLITSCNFTEQELIDLVTSGTSLMLWDSIKYPSFEFGGVKGSTVCSVAFRKPE